MLSSDTAGAPARLFAGRSGKGVRIAVIDSGVHPGHPHINPDRIDAGVAVSAEGRVVGDVDGFLDRLGHGTAVTAAIQEKAPSATCVPVRIFHDSLRTSATALIAAIRWAVDQEVDLINLSLGSPNTAHRPMLERAVDAARKAGIVIVAACGADDSPCYPGALPQVLGVGLDWNCRRDCFHVSRATEGYRFFASGYPRPIPGVPQRRNLQGISFAVAQMTGFAALALESVHITNSRDRPDLILQAMLAEASSQASWSCTTGPDISKKLMRATRS